MAGCAVVGGVDQLVKQADQHVGRVAGVGIAVLVMFLANLLAKRTPRTARPQPAAPAGATG